nr:zinc finger, CCHC-type [Tanacetum cinerariifolium]
MTTSVENNSVFRNFFEKQKLIGPNFIDWYRQLHLVLSTEDKENYLEHPIPAAPVALPGEQVHPEALAAHVSWVKGKKEVVVLMLLTMDLEIQRNLAHLGKGKMGYAPFAPKPKTPPLPKKDKPAKNAICHQCGKVGHWKRNCPVYFVELMKKKKLSQGASTSGIFTIELYSFLSKSWIYDTCCGTHICITTQGLRESKKLKPVSKNNLVYFMAVPRDGAWDIVHRTPPYTPQHNRVSERRNRTILDMVRSMMSQTTLPKSFRDYALETVACILNMVPSKKVDKTPYEI